MKIALAGSMSFMDKMNEIKVTLESFGHTVKAPTLTEEEIKTGADIFMDYVDTQGGVEKVLPDNDIWKIKEEAILGYKKIIDDTEVLLICNFDKGEKKNRIGSNVFMEMGYAFFIGKKICVLQGPPYGDDKIEEVLGMRPTFLYGDLGKITS
jgi:hypothetical protein